MDFLISLIFSNPYIPWILLAVGLFVAYNKLAPRLSIRAPVGGGGVNELVGKMLGPRFAERKFKKEVEAYKKGANYLAAGKLLEDHGDLAEAVDAYTSGSEYWAAASVLERMGRGERAAEMYLQAGDHKKAAKVFTDIGKPAKAASLFLEKGNTLEAARLFGQAGAWDTAADLYAKGGYPLRAAEAYEKKGDHLRAAESYEKHFMENVSYGTAYSSTAVSPDQKSALLAGRNYEKGKDLNRALQVYVKGGFFREAAGACVALGQYAKAAELYMRAEDPANAATAFERAGDRVRAANLRGEIALKEERIPEAAAFFQKGQDYLRAAELFESAGMLAEAAGSYEAGDSHAAAGSVYIRAGLKDRAAASYERAGEFETAAKLYDEVGNDRKSVELFDKAGMTFRSGEAAARSGDRERAIALLQRVGAQDENYRVAAELLARLFLEAGRPALAVERLRRILGSEPVSASNLDLYYWMAVAQEKAGQAAEALSLYEKILAEDLHFRDVESRVAAVRAGRPSPDPPSVVGPPRAAAPPRAPAPAGGAVPSAPPGVHAPAPAPAAPPAVRAHRFVNKQELGRGPLGTVFRAEEEGDGRHVALRVLPAEVLAGPGVLQGLAADLKAAARLSHPNLVKVLGLAEIDGDRCVVTEFVQGKNFAEALRAGHKMKMQQVHGLGRVLAQALSFIHGKGLVHGSIQPSNIMVASGVVKLADLGLGRLAQPRPPAPSYRAPENQLDVAGDLYALCAVLYHLLTGVHPRSQPQGAALPLPSKLAEGVPEAFDKLLIRGLHPRRELRHAGADQVLAELKDMMRIV
jgi:eukaryotic-like serine/threonine-protein kinase